MMLIIADLVLRIKKRFVKKWSLRSILFGWAIYLPTASVALIGEWQRGNKSSV